MRQELPKRNSVTEAIYEAGFNSNGRFYAESSRMLGMTPRNFRKGGAGEAIRFAVGECSLGSILVAASDKGVCAIFLGDDPHKLSKELEDRFPKARLIGGDKNFERMVAKVIGFVEARRLHCQLRQNSETDRLANCGACGSWSLRGQCHRCRHPLPPRGAHRRQSLRLSVGRRTKALFAGTREGIKLSSNHDEGNIFDDAARV